MIEHTRGPRLALLPHTHLGKGQSFYLVFLWVCVLFNFGLAVPGFRENRLLTEAVIFVNAIFATMLLLFFARPHDGEAVVPERTRAVPWAKAIAVGLVVWIGAVTIETAGVRLAYGDHHAGHAGRNGGVDPQTRFGPDAEWRINPLLKERPHN
jgi:hypothetical protein